MKRYWVYLLVVFAIPAINVGPGRDSVAYAHATPGTPPSGYKWITFEEINGHFLCPVDWSVSFSKGKLMGSLVLSNNAEPQNPAAARLTVNVIANLTQTNYRLVSKQVQRYRDDLQRTAGVNVVAHNKFNHGEYTGESIVIEQATVLPRPVKDHRLYLAHDQRDWLVVISFKSSAQEWASFGPVKEQMLSRFVLH